MNNKIAYVLQGGGALGAYQAGACQALMEKDIQPHWLVGISIGALNTAIITGNKPENRIKALSEFWRTISSEDSVVEHIHNINPFMTQSMRKMLSGIDTQTTILKGQKGFFTPKSNSFNLMNKLSNKNITELSYYDTSELKQTLLRYVDFNLINKGDVRVSLGVVQVETGEFLYFDNKKEILTPEHFMASAALPPGFPAIEINGEYYWDGGVANNSAISRIIEEPLKDNWDVYQIDLWRNSHNLPTNFDEVTQRLRDFKFASKNQEVDNQIIKKTKEKEDLKLFLDIVPDSVKHTEYYKNLLEKVQEGILDIKRIVYQGMNHETKERPYQFGITSIKEHWENGYNDMTNKFFKNNSLKI